MNGLCECGCGLPAPVATFTARKYGWVKGQPKRFILGHSAKGRPARHYRQTRDGRLHRLRAERALGKPLPIGVHVHHADGSKGDAAPLVICQDVAYHRLLHARMRIIKAGGNANAERLCSSCQQVKPISDFHPSRGSVLGTQGNCKVCAAAVLRARRASFQNM